MDTLSFIVAFALGVLLTLVAVYGPEQNALVDCARAHNVFKCEAVTEYRPVSE